MICVVTRDGDHFLGVHDSYNLTPAAFYACVFQLMPYGIHQPVSQYSKMEVRHRGVIIFVIGRTEVLQFFSFLMGYFLRTYLPGIAVLQCIHVHHL